MAKQSPSQKATVERVMHEFKHGELEQRDGTEVKNPKQAIAIALHEAGASDQESPKRNRQTLARTKAKERKGETAPARADEKRAASATKPASRSRDALYAEARRKNIPGRSKMNKSQLEHALQA